MVGGCQSLGVDLMPAEPNAGVRLCLHRSGREGETGCLLVWGCVCVRRARFCCWLNSLFPFPQLEPGSLEPEFY